MKIFSVGTSRWSGPAQILSSSYNIPSAAFPGKNLAFITEKAISMVKSDPAGYIHTLSPAFVYITAGLTDLTEKVTYGTGSNRYQEVIFYEDVDKAAERIIEEYEHSRFRLLGKNGIIPVFSGITPMSFWDWNYARLCQGKTSALHHVEDYWIMQEDLEDCIITINNRIREINAQTFPGLLTPRISDEVFQKKGADKPYRFRHNRLVDGVHPDSEVVDKWVLEMVKTIDKNAGIFREFDGEVCSTH